MRCHISWDVRVPATIRCRVIADSETSCHCKFRDVNATDPTSRHQASADAMLPACPFQLKAKVLPRLRQQPTIEYRMSVRHWSQDNRRTYIMRRRASVYTNQNTVLPPFPACSNIYNPDKPWRCWHQKDVESPGLTQNSSMISKKSAHRHSWYVVISQIMKHCSVVDRDTLCLREL